MKPLLFLELNEVAIPFVERYVAKGLLPNFQRVLAEHGCMRTQAESAYEHLEPWIQWVTVHSGLTFAQHGVFRLGDIVQSGISQIYEVLENKGVRVGAVSPMNADNRLRDPAFFVPDPWTGGRVSGPKSLHNLYAAIAQAVNDNAQGKIRLRSLFWLIYGFTANFRLVNLPTYVRYVLSARSKPWSRALFLDCLLADLFLRFWRTTKPGFASLFLNAAAHIQHHYFFNSTAYTGSQSNPDWYTQSGLDPLLDVYQLYDRILGQVFASTPGARVIIATGLSQVPCKHPVYYYRLKEHSAFLERLGIVANAVLPRMSRDFLVEFADVDSALKAEEKLASVHSADGISLFEIDNRGTSLFVTLAYPNRIDSGLRVLFDGGEISDFAEQVAFVAVKNGEHSTFGYLIDTGAPRAPEGAVLPLPEVFNRLVSAF